ncbi:amidase [Candidatus Binatia bacterium]|nr:amidase [Candidatus Binatia bacterium]
MGFSEYSSFDGVGLAELVRKGEVKPSELVEAAIERAGRHNATLNAIVHEGYDDARRDAAGALPDGPFRGVPFLVKDLYTPVKGWPMSNGSRWFGRRISEDDDELVRRYRSSGMVLLGKSNTPEFGITGTTESAYLGPCRNPWNPQHISGGSSGGSASAVAAGIVPMGHASDGLGSIRIPAACCGLVGLKTTRDRNPIRSPEAGGIMFSVNHIVSRTVRDSAVMLDWTGRPQKHAYFAPPAKDRPYVEELTARPVKLRIAFHPDPPSGTKLHPDVARTLEQTVRTLRELGYDVIEKPLRVDWRKLYRAQGVWSAGNFAGMMADHAAVLGRPPGEDDIEKLSRWIWENGKRVTAELHFQAEHVLKDLIVELLAQWDEHDLFLCPTMITPPPEIGYIDPTTLDPKELNHRQATTFGFTPPFNFTGQPAISLPLGQSADGLPIGMMFAARYADEATLFRVAAQLEEAMPWRARRPPVWG